MCICLQKPLCKQLHIQPWPFTAPRSLRLTNFHVSLFIDFAMSITHVFLSLLLTLLSGGLYFQLIGWILSLSMPLMCPPSTKAIVYVLGCLLNWYQLILFIMHYAHYSMFATYYNYLLDN